MSTAESHRFYWPSGSPCYEVPSADGKKSVKPTIAHARKGVCVPSVTTVLRETLASPGLTRWREENAADAMLATMENQSWDLGVPLTDTDRKHIKEDWQAEMERRSTSVTDPGKDIHAAVEKHFRGEDMPEEWVPWVTTAVAALKELGCCQEWTPEQTIPTHRGYGGRADLCCGNGGYVVDIKTRDFSDPLKVKPYEHEAMQVSAYGAALGYAAGANLYLSRSDPSLYALRVYEPEEQAEALANFDRLLAVFKSIRSIP